MEEEYNENLSGEFQKIAEIDGKAFYKCKKRCGACPKMVQASRSDSDAGLAGAFFYCARERYANGKEIEATIDKLREMLKVFKNFPIEI